MGTKGVGKMFRFFFGDRKNIDWYIKHFRPTWKRRIFESWVKATGYSWHEYNWLQTRKHLGRDNSKCYICNRKQNKILDWVKLIPTYDEQSQSLEYVCSDHGGIWWSCLEGKEVIFSHKPYWQRNIRDFYYFVLQQTVIPIRFVWFFLNDIYFWYIAIHFYWAWKELKIKLCEHS